MNSKLKTVLISLQIILVLASIWFLFFRKKKNTSISSSDLGDPNAPEKEPTNYDSNKNSSDTINDSNSTTAATSAEQVPLEIVYKSSTEKAPTKAKAPVIRPANITIDQWDDNKKSFRYSIVYNGFVENGIFAPGESPVDKKMGAGRVVVVQGYGAEYLEQLINSEAYKQYYQSLQQATQPPSWGKGDAVKNQTGTVEKPLTEEYTNHRYYDQKALDDARNYASHNSNNVLLEELAKNVHRDFSEFTSRYVAITIFKETTMSQEALLKFYLIDLNTGKRVLLEGQ